MSDGSTEPEQGDAGPDDAGPVVAGEFVGAGGDAWPLPETVERGRARRLRETPGSVLDEGVQAVPRPARVRASRRPQLAEALRGVGRRLLGRDVVGGYVQPVANLVDRLA